MNPGEGVPPLAFSAACPGSWAGVGGRVAVGPLRVRTGSGWSGRCGGRPAGCGEEVQPFVFAVPALGQVQGDVAPAVVGGAGGDVDEVAAQRGAACLGVGEAGQAARGAQQVVADGGAGEPGGVRGNEPEGR